MPFEELPSILQHTRVCMQLHSISTAQGRNTKSANLFSTTSRLRRGHISTRATVQPTKIRQGNPKKLVLKLNDESNTIANPEHIACSSYFLINNIKQIIQD